MMVEAARDLGFSALALTDRDGLYGAVKHIGACLTVGLSPIVGVDLPVLDEDGSSLGIVVVLAHGGNKGLGWSSLCAVVSKAHKGKEVGIKRSSLAQLIGSNCTILLGPTTDVGKATLGRSKTLASKLLQQWIEYFKAPGVLGMEIVSLLTEPIQDIVDRDIFNQKFDVILYGDGHMYGEEPYIDGVNELSNGNTWIIDGHDLYGNAPRKIIYTQQKIKYSESVIQAKAGERNQPSRVALRSGGAWKILQEVGAAPQWQKENRHKK
ncbi:MAG: PHP domain-containing protein [Bacteroidetes bacterium]|nr:PHP domain-containing protein [Bacteroidota bacterium]